MQMFSVIHKWHSLEAIKGKNKNYIMVHSDS